MSAYAHPVANVYAKVYADVHSTCLTYTPVHAWCSQHLSKCMHTLRKKMHIHSCMRAYAAVQKHFCHGSYCELILSLARASCRLRLPPALLLSRPNQSPDAILSKNPSKSTLAHDAVTAAVSHKHHSIIRVGAGLIQLSMVRTRSVATELTNH